MRPFWDLSRARLLPRLTRCASPTSMVFFDVETWPKPSRLHEGGVEHVFRLAVGIHVRLARGVPTSAVSFRARSPFQLASRLVSALHGHNVVWCVAHNLHFDFRLSGIIPNMDKLGLTWTKRPGETMDKQTSQGWGGKRPIPGFSLTKGATWFQMFQAGRKLLFVDSLNWFRVPLEELGQAMQLKKLPMPSFDAPTEKWFTYCQRDVEILKKAVLELVAWLKQEGMGTLKVTLPATAMSIFRTKYMEKEIWLPAHDSRLAGQRESFYGGRVYTPQLGMIEGPLHHVDVNSLFPWAMASEPMPRDYVCTVLGPTISGTKNLCKRYAVCAQVDVNSAREEYPVRIGKVTRWCTGQFRTWLAGPELRQALLKGHIGHVVRVRCFRQDHLFQAFVNDFYAMKQAARERGDTVREMFYKLTLNSLYGKFAQWAAEYDYHEDLAFDPAEAGLSWYLPPTGQAQVEERFGGLVRRRVGRREHGKAFPLIAAYITSAARVKMANYQALAGEGQWKYGDTDSLWLTQIGYNNLSSYAPKSSPQLGQLKYVTSVRWLNVLAPKEYVACVSASSWIPPGSLISQESLPSEKCLNTFKGIRTGARFVNPSSPEGKRILAERKIKLSQHPHLLIVEQEKWESLAPIFRDGWKSTVSVKKEIKVLTRAYQAGNVSASGLTFPVQLCPALQQRLNTGDYRWEDILHDNRQAVDPDILSSRCRLPGLETGKAHTVCVSSE